MHQRVTGTRLATFLRKFLVGGQTIRGNSIRVPYLSCSVSYSREKVGQTLRDSLHTHYKSSSKAKKARRLVEQAKASSDLTEISNKNMEISSKIDNLNDGVTLTANEAQMTNMFTQANLDILNELNRLNNLPL